MTCLKPYAYLPQVRASELPLCRFVFYRFTRSRSTSQSLVNGTEFFSRFPVSKKNSHDERMAADRVHDLVCRGATSAAAASQTIAKQPHSRHVWESIMFRTHVWFAVTIITIYYMMCRVYAHCLIINFIPFIRSVTPGGFTLVYQSLHTLRSRFQQGDFASDRRRTFSRETFRVFFFLQLKYYTHFYGIQIFGSCYYFQ